MTAPVATVLDATPMPDGLPVIVCMLAVVVLPLAALAKPAFD